MSGWLGLIVLRLVGLDLSTGPGRTFLQSGQRSEIAVWRFSRRKPVTNFRHVSSIATSENLMPSMITLDTFHLGAGESPLETSRDRWSHKIPTLTTHTPTLGMVTWPAMQDKEGFPHKIISSDRPGTIPTGPRDIMATHMGGLNQNSSQMIIAVIPIR